MQAIDTDILTTAQAWLAAGSHAWLCTIIKTYGSAPRPIGSQFLTDGFRRVGSISGGCVEDRFVERIAAGDFDAVVSIYAYGAEQSSGATRELPCGSTITLLIENLRRSPDTQWLMQLHRMICQGQSLSRRVHLQSGQVELSSEVNTGQNHVLLDEWSITHYRPVWQLLILGASAVAEFVAEFGLACGYDIKICDNREDFIALWRGPSTVEYCSPDNFIQRYATAQSAILALAHDPRVDDIGLMVAFDSPAFYIGAMGSKLTSHKRRERLMRSAGITEQQLTGLHAPIGLAIGSKTPAEIAIAILAQITAEKHKLVHMA